MPEWAKAVETSAELVLEIGDALVGGGEFAGAVQQLLLQDRQAVAGVAQGVDLLAQRVDLAGPAGLVVFLAVLGEFGALKGRRRVQRSGRQRRRVLLPGLARGSVAVWSRR